MLLTGRSRGLSCSVFTVQRSTPQVALVFSARAGELARTIGTRVAAQTAAQSRRDRPIRTLGTQRSMRFTAAVILHGLADHRVHEVVDFYASLEEAELILEQVLEDEAGGQARSRSWPSSSATLFPLTPVRVPLDGHRETVSLVAANGRTERSQLVEHGKVAPRHHVDGGT